MKLFLIIIYPLSALAVVVFTFLLFILSERIFGFYTVWRVGDVNALIALFISSLTIFIPINLWLIRTGKGEQTLFAHLKYSIFLYFLLFFFGILEPISLISYGLDSAYALLILAVATVGILLNGIFLFARKKM